MTGTPVRIYWYQDESFVGCVLQNSIETQQLQLATKKQYKEELKDFLAFCGEGLIGDSIFEELEPNILIELADGNFWLDETLDIKDRLFDPIGDIADDKDNFYSRTGYDREEIED
jgi:hypothetical protein